MDSHHALHARADAQRLYTPAGAPYRAAAGDIVQLHTDKAWLDVRITTADTRNLSGVVLAAHPTDTHDVDGRQATAYECLRFEEMHIWRCVDVQR
ncbi:hypothetical protein [Arhodomonas sp. AD133]|uniref:hypothetical protein n=1 Tax=Arhodomonas sp. AD133 TaxID=3415009 RepID=UPI003EBD3384